VTLHAHAVGSNGEVNHRRWRLGWPSPGLSSTREVPDDHHNSGYVHRDGHCGEVAPNDSTLIGLEARAGNTEIGRLVYRPYMA